MRLLAQHHRNLVWLDGTAVLRQNQSPKHTNFVRSECARRRRWWRLAVPAFAEDRMAGKHGSVSTLKQTRSKRSDEGTLGIELSEFTRQLHPILVLTLSEAQMVTGSTSQSS